MPLTPPEDLSKSAGIIFLHGILIVRYGKRYKNDEELAELLISRGLVATKRQLLELFKAVGYYRFSGYLVPFKLTDSDNYAPETSFNRVWEIYTFDRKLRLMAMDALARIEIAVRALIAKYHAEAYPSDPFCYKEASSLPGLSAKRHADLLVSIKRSIKNARTDADIAHLQKVYGITEYPPVWCMLEHVPFGVVTLYYEGLEPLIKQKVANTFFIQPNAFLGVLMTFKNARNICAHHSRFWNRHILSRIARLLGVRPELKPLMECLSKQSSGNYTTIFSVLSLCAHCIGYVRPQSKWPKRCKALLETADSFILHGMGVPENWTELQLWR